MRSSKGHQASGSGSTCVAVEVPTRHCRRCCCGGGGGGGGASKARRLPQRAAAVGRAAQDLGQEALDFANVDSQLALLLLLLLLREPPAPPVSIAASLGCRCGGLGRGAGNSA